MCLCVQNHLWPTNVSPPTEANMHSNDTKKKRWFLYVFGAIGLILAALQIAAVAKWVSVSFHFFCQDHQFFCHHYFSCHHYFFARFSTFWKCKKLGDALYIFTITKYLSQRKMENTIRITVSKILGYPLGWSVCLIWPPGWGGLGQKGACQPGISPSPPWSNVISRNLYRICFSNFYQNFRSVAW